MALCCPAQRMYTPAPPCEPMVWLGRAQEYQLQPGHKLPGNVTSVTMGENLHCGLALVLDVPPWPRVVLRT